MAIGLTKGAFPAWTVDAAGREIPPDHESDYTFAKAAEFAERFGETPEDRRIIATPSAPRRAAKGE